MESNLSKELQKSEMNMHTQLYTSQEVWGFGSVDVFANQTEKILRGILFSKYIYLPNRNSQQYWYLKWLNLEPSICLLGMVKTSLQAMPY